jgi:hypothetical protein
MTRISIMASPWKTAIPYRLPGAWLLEEENERIL